jgi:predicted ATPase
MFTSTATHSHPQSPSRFDRRIQNDFDGLFSLHQIRREQSSEVKSENIMNKHKVFISYNHADEAQAKRILIHLNPLIRDGTIDVWHDRCIKPGEDWRRVIDTEIEETDVALFLVSPGFLASEFCQDVEVPSMLLRQQNEALVVIPIIVDYCDWANIVWLGRTNVLPRDGKPVSSFRPQSKAWTQICQELRGIISKSEPRRVEVVTEKTRGIEKPSANLSLQKLLEDLPAGTDELFGREEDLHMLDEAYDDPIISIVALVAFGGVGKSALVRHWLTRKFGSETEPLFLGCSFYSQGTREHAGTADQFIVNALEKLGDPEPNKGPLGIRGQRLAKLVSAKPTILVLDGLEPLQFGPGVEQREGQLKDAGIRELLAGLAQNPGKSLCIVTSRLELKDAAFERPEIIQRSLDVLPLEAARQLLRYRGVEGDCNELDAAANYLGRHALALVLAAEYLHTFKEGRVQDITQISLIEENVRAGRHAKSVMKAYETSLFRDKNFLDIELLRVLGLFDRPLRWEWLSELRCEPIIPGVTDELVRASEQEIWEAVSRLRQWGLMIYSGLNPEFALDLDAHPLIREYFGSRLHKENEAGWKKANERLFEYLKKNSKLQPDTLDEMMPLLVGLVHGCKAGRYRDALHEIYLPRIMRNDQFYAANKLGATGALLSVMTHFFEAGDWRLPVTSKRVGTQGLDESDQITVLSHAGMFLTAARGYASPEVEVCYSKARDLCLKAGDTRQLFIILFGLWRYYVVRGQVQEAEQVAERMYDLAEKLRDASLYAAAERVISSTLYFQGKNAMALEHAKKGVNFRNPEDMLSNAVLFLNEPTISCQDYVGLALWNLGHPTEALQQAQEAVNLSRALGHQHTLAVAIFFEIKISQFCGDVQNILEKASELIKLCRDEGFTLWRIAGEAFEGWALTKMGQEAVGLAQLKGAIVNWERSGSGLFLIYWFTLLADAYGAMGEAEKGINLLDNGLQICIKNNERWWEADLLRLKGDLLLLQDGQEARAELSFLKARDLARKQGALSLELRAVMGLCIILKQTGEKEEARAQLLETYGKFTSGFETGDLKAAQLLLDSLA